MEKNAAKAGGVTRMTLYRWLERGRGEINGPYCYICYAIESVQAKMTVEFLEAVRRSVFETTTIVREHVRELPDGTTLKEIWKETRPPNIRGALWWLERRAEGFGRRPERSGELMEPFKTVIVDPAESESDDDTKPTGRLGRHSNVSTQAAAR